MSLLSVAGLLPAVGEAQQTFQGCDAYLCHALTWTRSTAIADPASYTGVHYLSSVTGVTTIRQALLDVGATTLRDGLVRPAMLSSEQDPGWYLFGPAPSGVFSLSLVGLAPGAQFSWSTEPLLTRTLPSMPSEVRFDIHAASTALARSSAAVTVTPEPMTWALLGTGLLGVAGVSRRRRRTTS